MNFKAIVHWFFISILLAACSDEARETELVNLHATAGQDVVAIEFPATTETVVSINSLTALAVQGIKSNGVDQVSLASQIDWSVSNGTASTIDQDGRLTAGPTAETITVYAKLGILSSSIDIRVSDAKFDQVISLDKAPFTLQMCQSQTITPMGRYIGTLGVEERKVDNIVLSNIEWSISPPQSAYIVTTGSTTTLYSLAAEDLIIQAQETGNAAIASLDQTIGNGLNSIKICNSTSTDYANCSNVSSDNVEQDQEISFIAVGQYSSGSYQNISRTSKWGISNSNMSGVLSSNLQQINITGEKVPDEDLSTSSTLSVACGDINQTIPGDTDISEGIILNNNTVDCTSNCQSSSAEITIDQLSVESLAVTLTANNVDHELTHADTFNLETPRPDEIVLEVSATFSNSTDATVITNNTSLIYEIEDIDGIKVIEAKENTPDTFTVLAGGIAQIRIRYRNANFTARINIP